MPTLPRRNRASASSSRCVMFTPATITSPPVTDSRPAATIKRDDLPDPEGPRSAMASPGSTSNETPVRILTSPAGLRSARWTSCRLTVGIERCMRDARDGADRRRRSQTLRYFRRPCTINLPGRLGLVALGLLCVVLATNTCGTARASDRHSAIKILAFGTSLMQGYGLPPGTEVSSLLESRLKSAHVNAKVINAGVSGDTSAGGLARLDWSLADRPDVVILEFGGNDALRGLAPGETERNLSAMLNRFRSMG